jgi:N-acyl homoserine lactone hydrolase
MTQSATTPRIDVLLSGFSLSTDSGTAAFCAVALVEGVDEKGETRRILFDAAHVGRRVALWEALARRGLGPRDIDGVVLSHSHWDHIQNIDVFDHAPIMIHPFEREYSLEPHRNDWATPAWTGLILERQMIVDVQDGDQLLQGVKVVDLPGHTPGSIGLAVETSDGLDVLTGDALHHASYALVGENPLIFWDRDAAHDSIARVVQMADRIYPGHDQSFRLVNGAIEYVEPFHMSMTRFAPSPSALDWHDLDTSQWIMPDLEQQSAAREQFKAAAQARKAQKLGVVEAGWVQWWEVDPEARS